MCWREKLDSITTDDNDSYGEMSVLCSATETVKRFEEKKREKESIPVYKVKAKHFQVEEREGERDKEQALSDPGRVWH